MNFLKNKPRKQSHLQQSQKYLGMNLTNEVNENYKTLIKKIEEAIKTEKQGPSTVTQACNSSTQKAEIGRTVVKANPSKKVNETPQQTSCMVDIPVILTTQEADTKRITVQSQPGKIVSETLSWKKPITKKGWWSDSR
jgi:hypothetical protein